MPDYSTIKPPTPPKKKGTRGRKPIPRDKNGKMIRKPPEETILYRCCSCGTEYDKLSTNFVTSNSSLFFGWGGYVPICRECLAKYYNNVVLPALDYDEAKAIEVICGICDWPYSEDLIDLAQHLTETNKKHGGNVPLIITYGTRKNMTQFAKKASTYLDVVKRRWADSKVIKDASDITSSAGGDSVDEGDVWFFGPGYTPNEYKYLREQYNDWCERYDCQTKAQEEIFKSLAIAQLNVQKAQMSGEQKKTTDALKTLQDLMDTAKIKPKQKNETALVEQNTFGTLIQKWENEEPIPDPKPEWKDVDGIKKYIGGFFLGHLTKMFKLENEWSQIYDDEVGRYTVEPPHYIDDEENDDGFNTMLKQMRGTKSDSSDGEE